MKIAILGSTGSIGTQTLKVVEELNAAAQTESNPHIEIAALAAGDNVERIARQAACFRVPLLSVATAEGAARLEELLKRTAPELKPEIFYGEEGLLQVAECGAELLVTAIVGMVGLRPTLAAIRRGTDIALANKETLVAAGELVMREAAAHSVRILPVDSEHSAIFQCLHGNDPRDRSALRKIFLTASGGPFRGRSFESLWDVTPEETLRHPTWSMGSKITVDSATLMNKGLEVIEAMHLFQVKPEEIDVVVHPQSIIHSMVLYRDGSVLAQLGNPDMKVPIRLALTYPYRAESHAEELDLTRLGCLTFEKPDTNAFPCLEIALRAAKTGGTMPAVMNGANEAAVSFFLKRHIKFNEIQYNISRVMDRHLNSGECPFRENPSLEEIVEADRWARAAVGGMI
ncbi:MAG: 1-deoxy-D-xylulose-5-phosphate reductoisomerase [Clostridiales bacterium]|nr:1-deoxy-D-xylulose-5-phosphate reductoisomerase [Clostridiales bacterium]